MKGELCRRLALGNIKKNYRFFIPRILTETGLVACFYIIFTLACDTRLANVKGGSYLPTFMWMGAVIIGLLSLVLILYTNSFLMKQRKREFGLYSVLGMEKKHICRILFAESLICTVLSVIAGVCVGILFYKLSSLAICRILKTEIVVGFYFITAKTIVPAGAIFVGIDALAYIFNCIGIARMKPVDFLASIKTGEKEPKVKWLLLVLGALCLGGGYYISLSTENPLKAILVFFAAVLLVIVGTYFLFVAGSIFVLKAMKKRDGCYYRPRNFTAISGLLYRMKQNAVGLASVAILATGVLVMISSTFCLYSRTESILKTNYPEDCYIPTVYCDGDGNTVHIPDEYIIPAVEVCAKENGLSIKESFTQEYFEVSFSKRDGELITDRATVSDETDYSSLCNITFITEDQYVKLGGSPLLLGKNDVAVCSYNIKNGFGDDRFTLCGKEYSVKERLTTFPIVSHLVSVNCYGMVVSDEEVFYEIFNAQKDAYGVNASELQCRLCLTLGGDKSKNGDGFQADVWEALTEYFEKESNGAYTINGLDTVWETRHDLYGMYGTLLFLGILLGLVCLFATVLIIYYKQISEGYEDRSRYQIMQKIGMSGAEIKETIKRQTMLVFFLPLVTAGIHVAFAYPILTKLMEILLLDNRWLFAKWCIIVYLVFALVYVVIYKLTAKTYYKIVY